MFNDNDDWDQGLNLNMNDLTNRNVSNATSVETANDVDDATINTLW